MDALSLVRARGGVMHRSSLRDAGFSPYRVRRELEAGRLISIGRDRVALPQLQPDIVRAARAGLRLTCVTEARRRGLCAFADSALLSPKIIKNATGKLQGNMSNSAGRVMSPFGDPGRA